MFTNVFFYFGGNVFHLWLVVYCSATTLMLTVVALLLSSVVRWCRMLSTPQSIVIIIIIICRADCVSFRGWQQSSRTTITLHSTHGKRLGRSGRSSSPNVFRFRFAPLKLNPTLILTLLTVRPTKPYHLTVMVFGGELLPERHHHVRRPTSN